MASQKRKLELDDAEATAEKRRKLHYWGALRHGVPFFHRLVLASQFADADNVLEMGIDVDAVDAQGSTVSEQVIRFNDGGADFNDKTMVEQLNYLFSRGACVAKVVITAALQESMAALDLVLVTFGRDVFERVANRDELANLIRSSRHKTVTWLATNRFCGPEDLTPLLVHVARSWIGIETCEALIKAGAVLARVADDVFRAALMNGGVELLKYLTDVHNLEPPRDLPALTRTDTYRDTEIIDLLYWFQSQNLALEMTAPHAINNWSIPNAVLAHRMGVPLGKIDSRPMRSAVIKQLAVLEKNQAVLAAAVDRFLPAELCDLCTKFY